MLVVIFVFVQDKSYSRFFLDRGRLKLKMRQDDGKLVNPTFARRKWLCAK